MAAPASPLWAQLSASLSSHQVAAALSGLVSGFHSPSTLEQARQLLALLQRSAGDLAVAGPALTLLARWARQLAPLLQQPGPGVAGREADAAREVLQQAVQEALKVVAAGGVQQGPGPAAALFLGSAAAGCPTQLRWQVAEALGSALLAHAATRDPVAAAPPGLLLGLPPRELIWGLAGLLPALLDHPVAACWVLSALLSACQLSATEVVGSPPGALVDALAPCYAMMRSVGGATLSRVHPGEGVPLLLQPLAAVLLVAVGEATAGAAASVDTGLGGPSEGSTGGSRSSGGGGHGPPLLGAASGSESSGGADGSNSLGGLGPLPALQHAPWALLPQAAAAVLCLGGLLEGVCRAVPSSKPCQALSLEAEEMLLRAAKAAAFWDLESLTPHGPASSDVTPRWAGGGPEGGSRERPPGDLVKAAVALLRDCVSLACVQAYQGCGRPVPSPAIMHCQAGTLLRSTLSLAPLFRLAAAGAAPAEANALLGCQLAGAAMERAAEIAGAVARAASAAPRAERVVLVWRFREAARRAYRGYQSYILGTPGGFLGAVDSQAVRSILDKLFMSATVVLSAVWATDLAEHAADMGQPCSPAATAATPSESLQGLLLGAGALAAVIGSGGRVSMVAATPAPAALAAGAGSFPLPALAAELLAVFADLQFARLPLDLFGSFLKEVLAAVSGDVVAARALAAYFPPYSELSAPCEGRAGAPAWLMDAVVAAKVQFLMSVVMPCCQLLSEPIILEQLAPLSFLYLLHPHPPASAAAHQLFAALLPAVSPRQREALAAYYVERTLEGYPGATALEPLQQGLVSVLCALPEGSSLALYCLEAMMRKCRALEADGRDPELVVHLFGLAVGLLLVVDHALLRPALSAVGSFVESEAAVPGHAGGSAATALLAAAFDVLATTDDTTRKPELVQWYQQLAAGVARRQQQQHPQQ